MGVGRQFRSLSFSPRQISLHRHEYLSSIDTGTFSEQAAEKIFRYGAPVGSVIEHHPRLERCMEHLQHLMTEAEGRGEVLAAGTVVTADSLTHSSGRFDRHWYAPAGGL